MTARMSVSGYGSTTGGPDIGFHTTFPGKGDYRLFLDFQHQGVVRTAEFTVSVGSANFDPTPERAPSAEPTPTRHEH